MRVLIAAYDCIPGAASEPGLGWQFVSLAARNHEVWALTKESNRAAIEADPGSKDINWSFIDVDEKIGPIKTGTSFGDVVHIMRWFKPAMKRAKALHADVDFDVTHYISFGAYWINEPFSLLGVPHLFGPVTGGQVIPPGLDFESGVVGKGANTVRSKLPALVMGRKAWQNMATSSTTIMVAATEVTLQRMRDAGAQNVRLFRPSFALETEEFEEFATRDTNHPGRPVTFAMSGRLLKWKGHDIGLRAFAIARNTIPQIRLEFTGWGPEEQNLLDLIDELGIGDVVNWHGRLSRDDERGLLGDCDVFVLPSVRDAGSTLLVYAMALGRSIAALETGAVAEMTGEASRRASVESKEAAIGGLADILIELAQDEGLREQMGEVGRRRARELFSRDAVHSALDGWYDELAQRNANDASN